ncbi:MAG: hypothetical protein HFI29_00995 [Lachnospiraceae bacterium]|jgi:hypothetical protein|nr:hypothetical protein [Lachnospiraceae bacterium]
MQCPNCGAELEAGSIYCSVCLQELQIVPDYDPLEEIIIGQDPEEPSKPLEEQLKKDSSREKDERKSLWQSKTFRQILLLSTAIFVCFGAFLIGYFSMGRSNSYSYQLKKGTELLEEEQYQEALPYLKQAQSIQEGRQGTDIVPLCEMSKAYEALEAKELAVECLWKAVALEETARGESQELLELYLQLMELLNETKQTSLVQEVIDTCAYDAIREELLPYRVEKPTCSLAEGVYHYYVSLELDAEYGAIFYTLDGTEPTRDSARYEKPISLTEGENLLCAVAINKKGMVSEPLVQIYRLEFQYDPDMDEED